MTRAVVVGAGHNGLVAALHLAESGLEVEVLEHAPRPGGATSTGELTLPGFRHDHCAGFNPVTLASPAMRELQLGLDWVDPPTCMAHPFADGSAIALERDVAATVASLEAVARGAGAPWREAMARLAPHADLLVRTVLGPLPPVRPALGLALALRRDALDWARRCVGSVEALGHELFAGAQRPTAWLAGSAQHTGLPPFTAGSAAFGLLLQLLGHTHGWGFPRGGQGEIIAALVRRIEAAGGTVRCHARAERVLVRRGRACGVRLAGGEDVGADAVVTAISPRPLRALLPDDALPGRLLRRLETWRYGTAAFKADYALDAPVPWTAEEARRAAVVHVGGELTDLARAAQTAQRGELPEHPALVVGQHSLFDPTRAPAGRHTLYVYGHVPSRTELDDEEIAARFEAELERYAPGFGGLVLGRRLRGAAATEAENPSLVGGDLAGGAHEVDQLVVFRPAPELCRYRTPLPGLYVAGASVHPGAAVHGMSGRGAARAVLRDRGLRRRGARRARTRARRRPRA